ncbi:MULTISPECIES: hypothetical protein [unclassified Mesorhizobium]|uniref:hypothetical protein n=1 Tax=unclassified Mesorhizobium TaxID=325217 RepID=UPI00112E9104|nr:MULTISPECIES: hypothetical protein [unclassified Mesorhizobium]TPK97395.1 hypothetical protein FJ567_19485 [Mesorhizobium sp. B2-4-16]TPL63486.1 hypothetical protein FJ956_23410 [Mesorhizobium sp. B2-4-3]
MPRDLWSPLIDDRVNAAFALGGGKLLLDALQDWDLRRGEIGSLRLLFGRMLAHALFKASSLIQSASQPWSAGSIDPD